jgi:hypothetical protein
MPINVACIYQIFGIKKSDHIWNLGQNEETLSQKISNLGLNLSYFELYNSNVVTQIFQSIFFLQSLVLATHLFPCIYNLEYDWDLKVDWNTNT